MDTRTSLALWLRAGRSQRKLTLDDVARITKIQPRILEKLETGQVDGLPAEVFVRGFVRSFARCVGLDEGEALTRYGACQGTAPVARALVASMAQMAPVAASAAAAAAPIATATAVPAAPVTVMVTDAAPVAETEVVEVAAVAETTKKRSRKKPRGRKRKGGGEVKPSTFEASEAVEQSVDAPVEPSAVVEASAASGEPIASTIDVPALVEQPVQDVSGLAEGSAPVDTTLTAEVASEPTGTWQPTMPPIPTAPSVPWRRRSFTTTTTTTTAPVMPSLVIDDADPDSAEREQEERTAKEPNRLSFLPPILLDRDDRSARQGGLTLAVIILLIAATLTLSYLMRRPSVSGDGVTMRATPATLA